MISVWAIPVVASTTRLACGKFHPVEVRPEGTVPSRRVVQSYRLSSGADDANQQRQDWFAQMNVKMLTA